MFAGSSRSHRTSTAVAAVRVCRLLAIALLLGLPMAAQSPGSQNGPPMPRSPVLDPNLGFNDTSMVERQVKMLNVQRQKSIVSDTAKILQLARELNDDANAENPTLSPAERMRKADEIEKLARSVREKMINAISVPEPANPFTPWSAR